MRMIFNEICLNEIPAEIETGKLLIEQFIMTYSDAIKSEYSFSRSILTCVDLNHIELAKGYFVYQWRNNVDRDIARRFSGMCDRQDVFQTCWKMKLNLVVVKGWQGPTYSSLR